MSSDQPMGDDVYQPDGSEVREDQGILDREDTLDTRAADPYDEGYSPPERPLGVDHRGTTAEEQRRGETLDERLAEELPDPALTPLPEDGPGSADLEVSSEDEVVDDGEVGGLRSGRLVAPDEGAHEDVEKDMLAEDVGIDGGAASAEEAAVHLIPDEAESEESGPYA